jgi:hypothetical protein
MKVSWGPAALAYKLIRRGCSPADLAIGSIQVVWGHEGTQGILTFDSILLLHASHFGILGGKPLVP